MFPVEHCLATRCLIRYLAQMDPWIIYMMEQIQMELDVLHYLYLPQVLGLTQQQLQRQTLFLLLSHMDLHTGLAHKFPQVHVQHKVLREENFLFYIKPIGPQTLLDFDNQQ